MDAALETFAKRIASSGTNERLEAVRDLIAHFADTKGMLGTVRNTTTSHAHALRSRGC